jgi:hypothetical protein
MVQGLAPESVLRDDESALIPARKRVRPSVMFGREEADA